VRERKVDAVYVDENEKHVKDVGFLEFKSKEEEVGPEESRVREKRKNKRRNSDKPPHLRDHRGGKARRNKQPNNVM